MNIYTVICCQILLNTKIQIFSKIPKWLKWANISDWIWVYVLNQLFSEVHLVSHQYAAVTKTFSGQILCRLKVSCTDEKPLELLFWRTVFIFPGTKTFWCVGKYNLSTNQPKLSSNNNMMCFSVKFDGNHKGKILLKEWCRDVSPL